ncbi:MAG: hypothetical protein ACKOTZ_01150 [Chloroflexota bacterium]
MDVRRGDGRPAAGLPSLLPRATRDSDLAVWLGLFVAVALLLGVGTPPVPIVAALLASGGTLIVALRWRVGPLAILVLLALGIWLRMLNPYGGYSDVLTVVQAAARTMLAGTPPYGIGYDASLPPGAPFAYGPVALAWYLPMLDDPRRMELWLSFGILGVLALRGRPLGLAVYAVLAPLLVTATDGSNDTSAGVLLLIALLVAQRAPLPGAILLALAAGFKPYAAAWLPPLLAYGGIAPGLIGFAAGSLVAWGPALFAWGPERILWSFRTADAVHQGPYYSLAWVTGGLGLSEATWQAFRLVAGAATAAVGWLSVRSARSFIVAGAAIYVVTLFAGWWSTFAYLAALAPVLCWHLDDWAGLGSHRVRWPGDPVGRITTAVDARFPILRPADDRTAA